MVRYAASRLRHGWMRRSAWQRSLIVTMSVGVVLFVLVPFFSGQGETAATCQGTSVRTTNPFETLYRNDTHTQCQETMYIPFMVGCPASCQTLRPDLDPNEPLYRTDINWWMGQPILSNHPPLPKEGNYYSKGYNYQSATADFAQVFGKTSDDLESLMLQQFPDLSIRTQSSMHVSLAYVCCLRLEEAYHVNDILRRFVKQTSFFIPNVAFERLECWKERFNSITNILIVDNASQQHLLQLLERLVRMIQAEGVPVVVARQTQMPFHSTLLGLSFGETYSTEPHNNIDRVLGENFSAVQSINKTWKRQCITIHHDPLWSSTPKQHTHFFHE